MSRRDLNPLAATVRAETSRHEAEGGDAETALRRSTLRIFSARPGAYGAGLQALIDENLWQERSDFAEAFLVWSGYAYGEATDGIAARDLLEDRLSTSDAVLHNQDNREHDILDSDDYYQFAGGLSAAVAHLSGRDVPVYHNDHSLAERPVIRTLGEDRACRSRPCQQPEMDRRRDAPWLQGRVRDGGDA